MAHERINWKDHIVEHPRTYTEITNEDGTKTFADAPGEIIQQGTPMSATNFNYMEDGISDIGTFLDALYTIIQMKLMRSEHTLDSLDEEKLGRDENAVSATKLLNARTITINGKATAAAVSFDGTGNITLSVSALDPTGLTAPVAVAKGGTNAANAADARTNLGAAGADAMNKELRDEITTLDLLRSIQQMESRAMDGRVTLLEAQMAALT